MVAQNMVEVLNELDKIVAWACKENSRLGYFAALYRKVTLKVKEGIETGFFDDGPRMEALDVAFANRYLAALTAYLNGEAPTRSWLIAFQSAQNPRLLILQHLFLGINAHINLDLGIAAAEIVTEADINALKDDFEKINLILSGMVDEIQNELGQLSPWLALLDKVGGQTDEKFADFSLKVAREAAWTVAKRMVSRTPDQKETEIDHQDRVIAELARLIVKPGPMIRIVLWIIRCVECKDVRRIIEFLT